MLRAPELGTGAFGDYSDVLKLIALPKATVRSLFLKRP